MNDFLLITSAASFAAEAHKGQVRKELNEPYIVHPCRVAKMAAQLGLTAPYIAAAYLHDVLEDTNTPHTTILNLFPGQTFQLTKALTKWWEDGHPSEVVAANKAAYYQNIVRSDALVLKFLDRIDNMHDFARMAKLSPGNHKWAARYLEKTKAEFEPLTPSVYNDKVIQWFDNALVNLSVAVN